MTAPYKFVRAQSGSEPTRAETFARIANDEHELLKRRVRSLEAALENMEQSMRSAVLSARRIRERYVPRALEVETVLARAFALEAAFASTRVELTDAEQKIARLRRDATRRDDLEAALAATSARLARALLGGERLERNLETLSELYAASERRAEAERVRSDERIARLASVIGELSNRLAEVGERATRDARLVATLRDENAKLAAELAAVRASRLWRARGAVARVAHVVRERIVRR